MLLVVGEIHLGAVDLHQRGEIALLAVQPFQRGQHLGVVAVGLHQALPLLDGLGTVAQVSFVDPGHALAQGGGQIGAHMMLGHIQVGRGQLLEKAPFLRQAQQILLDSLVLGMFLECARGHIEGQGLFVYAVLVQLAQLREVLDAFVLVRGSRQQHFQDGGQLAPIGGRPVNPLQNLGRGQAAVLVLEQAFDAGHRLGMIGLDLQDMPVDLDGPARIFQVVRVYSGQSPVVVDHPQDVFRQLGQFGQQLDLFLPAVGQLVQAIELLGRVDVLGVGCKHLPVGLDGPLQISQLLFPDLGHLYQQIALLLGIAGGLGLAVQHPGEVLQGLGIPVEDLQ